MKNILNFVPFLLISILPEFGFARLGVLSLCVTFLVIIMAIYKYRINKYALYSALCFIALILIHLQLSLYFGREAYIFLYVVLFLSAICGIGLISVFLHLDERLKKKIISLIIIFHSAIFSVQFLLWYLFQVDFDPGYYLNLSLTPHRAFHYNGSYRATGLFTEPSIYSSYILAFVAIYYFITGRLSKICLFAIFTSILSFSTLAALQAICILFICYVRFNFASILVAIISLISAVFLVFDELVKRYELFLKGSDGSNNFKLDLIHNWLSNSDYFYLGYSLVSKEGMPSYYQALGDLGIFINNLTIYGVFFGGIISVFIIFTLLSRGERIRSKLLFLVVTVKLSTFTSPFLFVFINMFMIQKNSVKLRCKYEEDDIV